MILGDTLQDGMDNKKLVLAILGFIAGYLSNGFFQDNEPQIITKTKIQIDTVYVQKIDTVHISKTRILHEQIRDTVIIGYEPKINRFKTSSPFLYGNTQVSGEVLGEVLKIDIQNNFKIPQVTNTITNTKTIIKKPSGIYLMAGINNSSRLPVVGGIFIKDKYLIGLNTGGFQVGYKLGR